MRPLKGLCQVYHHLGLGNMYCNVTNEGMSSPGPCQEHTFGGPLIIVALFAPQRKAHEFNVWIAVATPAQPFPFGCSFAEHPAPNRKSSTESAESVRTPGEPHDRLPRLWPLHGPLLRGVLRHGVGGSLGTDMVKEGYGP